MSGDGASAARASGVPQGPGRAQLCRAGFAGRAWRSRDPPNATRSLPLPTRDGVSGRLLEITRRVERSADGCQSSGARGASASRRIVNRAPGRRGERNASSVACSGAGIARSTATTPRALSRHPFPPSTPGRVRNQWTPRTHVPSWHPAAAARSGARPRSRDRGAIASTSGHGRLCRGRCLARVSAARRGIRAVRQFAPSYAVRPQHHWLLAAKQDVLQVRVAHVVPLQLSEGYLDLLLGTAVAAQRAGVRPTPQLSPPNGDISCRCSTLLRPRCFRRRTPKPTMSPLESGCVASSLA